MTLSLKNIGDKLFKLYLCLVGAWIISALCFQTFFIYLHFSGNDELGTKISNEIMWKIDGTFKNDPNNIWYEAPSK